MGGFLRSIFAVLAGLFTGMLIIMGVQYAGTVLFPVPLEAQGQLPLGELLVTLAGWALGSFVGAWIAGRTAGRAPMVHGMVAAVLNLVIGVTTMFAFGHPVWMWVLGIAAFIGLGYLGAGLAGRGKTAKAAA